MFLFWLISNVASSHIIFFIVYINAILLRESARVPKQSVTFIQIYMNFHILVVGDKWGSWCDFKLCFYGDLESVPSLPKKGWIDPKYFHKKLTQIINMNYSLIANHHWDRRPCVTNAAFRANNLWTDSASCFTREASAYEQSHVSLIQLRDAKSDVNGNYRRDIIGYCRDVKAHWLCWLEPLWAELFWYL